jgi:hypothetical protein
VTLARRDIAELPGVPKDKLLSAAITAFMNGAIQTSLPRRKAPIRTDADAIRDWKHSSLASVEPLAAPAAKIHMAVRRRSFDGQKKSYVATAPWLFIRHGLLAVGGLAEAVPGRRHFATAVDASIAKAAVLAGAVIGHVAAIVTFMTSSQIAGSAA